MLENMVVGGSPLLSDLAKGLFEGRHSLVFDNESIVLSRHLTIEQLLLLFCSEEDLNHQQVVSLQGLLRSQGFRTLGDFWNEAGGWKELASFRRAIRWT